MTLVPDDIIKLALAILLGGIIGAEREFLDKAAGFRTMILICTGAALFTVFSARLAGNSDPARIAAQIVSGVGFLGAGAIMRDAGRVTGLTTAASIWLTAALGMGIGGGQYLISCTAAFAILIVLTFFPRIEAWIDNIRDQRSYEIVCQASPEKLEQLAATFRQCGLRIRGHKQIRTGSKLTCTWEAYGSPQCHDQLAAKLLADADVQEFRF